MFKHRTVIIGTLWLILAGCDITRETARTSEDASAKARSLVSQPVHSGLIRNASHVKISKGVYVGGRSIRNDKGDPLPQEFERDDGITISRLRPISLRGLAHRITQQTGIPVVLADSSGHSVNGQQNSEQEIGFAIGQVPPGHAAGSSSEVGGAERDFQTTAFPLHFSGRLSDLLEVASAHFNAVWRYGNGRIVIDRTVNRSFDVPALPLVASLSFDIGSGLAANGSSGGGRGHAASTNTVSDIWKELNSNLSAILGYGHGSNTYSVSITTGVVNVTADPLTMMRVESFLKAFNGRLKDQVAINVTVYSVLLRDSEKFDINVAALFRNSEKYGIGLGNAVAGDSVPLPGGGVTGLGWALLDMGSNFQGSNALISALSEKGEVSVVTSASVTTLNGVPVPLQVGQERDYVSQVDVTTQDGVTTTDISTDSVSVGFNLHLIPRVDRTGSLTLQFGINISELAGSEDGFDTFTANGQKVQLKRVNQRNFVQQARIPHRTTLVLAGFEQVRTSSSSRGVGHALFPLLGGGRNSVSEREIIVIAITPTILKQE